MHSTISQDNENPGKDPQLNDIRPQRLGIEAERAQDRGTRDRDIEAVFLVHEREVRDFVHDEGFEGVVEDGDSLEPEH